MERWMISMKHRNYGSIFKKTGLFILLLGIVLGVWGCGMFPDFDVTDEIAQEQGQAEDLIVVGYSQLGSESIWRTANTVSMQNALTKENGFFLIMENGRQRQENQIRSIRSFISQRVDYIVFSPVTASGWDTVLQEAKDAGIPVIIADRMIDVEDDTLYTAWVGTDAHAEGEKAGRWLEQELRKRGRQYDDINIVILTGTEGSSAQLGRSAGFHEIARRYANWHILAEESGDFTPAKGKEVMKKFLRIYPDIDIVVSQNDDMTFGALEAIQDEGLTTGIRGDIEIISFDAVHSALELVEDGTINVDIECNPDQGELVADLIHRLENGETVQKQNPVEEKVFSISNVGLYINDRTY